MNFFDYKDSASLTISDIQSNVSDIIFDYDEELFNVDPFDQWYDQHKKVTTPITSKLFPKLNLDQPDSLLNSSKKLLSPFDEELFPHLERIKMESNLIQGDQLSLEPWFFSEEPISKRASVSTEESPKPTTANPVKHLKINKRNATAKHAMRADTISKTLLRAVKRHFCEELCGGNRFLYNNKRHEEFNQVLDKIDEYCETHFLNEYPTLCKNMIMATSEVLKLESFSSLDNISSKEELEFYKLKLTLASLVLRMASKKGFAYNIVKGIYTNLSDVMYKFTHWKIAKLMKDTPFKHIFRHYVESGAFAQMLKTDESLNTTPELFIMEQKKLIALCD